MGDIPPGSSAQHLVDPLATGLAQDEHQGQINPSLHTKSPPTNTPFYSQLSAIPQGQPRPDLRSPAHPQSPQYPLADHGPGPLNMGAMAGALPEYGSSAAQAAPQVLQHDQRQLPGASTSALVYQLQHNLQVPGLAPAALPNQYAPAFTSGQFPQNFVPPPGGQHPNYSQFPGGQQRVTGPGPMQAPYQNFPQHSQFAYYPGPYGPPAQYPQGFPGQHNQAQQMYNRRQSGEMGQQEGGFGGNRPTPTNIPGDPGAIGSMLGGSFAQAPGFPRPGPASSIPRGPPRKPKQSGHALWVGNLPPGTTVVALKDHFSRDATKDIESLFLISKSNCAFVNYRTEASCTAAMHRFHDSRFNGVRLVCRLRRSSAPTSGVPTGPSAMVGSPATGGTPPDSGPEGDAEVAKVDGQNSPRKSSEEAREASTSKDKYFIVKSLTLQDLELSVRNGIWATQSHNEEALNKAFETAENVFLIFSANKSGEYFGYARMASRILEDAEQLMGSAPKPEPNLDATDVPKSIPTPATEFAPKGRIIDDSARGTIFWEAELTDSESEEEQKEDAAQSQGGEGDGSGGVAQSWGKPFKVEWISTNRLPFYRTRGLRNPWNANREVKIARDGTELEPSVGERLLQMFHRLGPSTAPGPMMPPPMGGPSMRPF